ncbi:MAG TPA: hypothetical protein VMH31_13315 [Methylomirabilota bacterium]|nr:hypothetical protein [Methylomirabilota bacterium]
MLHSRRSLLCLLVSSSALLGSPLRLFARQTPHPPPQPLPSPNAPNPNVPQGLEGRPTSSKDQRALDKQIQQEISADIDKMAALVAEMKQELSFTNTGSVLSVNFLKQAGEVEKLAKRVKSLAKG